MNMNKNKVINPIEYKMPEAFAKQLLKKRKDDEKQYRNHYRPRVQRTRAKEIVHHHHPAHAIADDVAHIRPDAHIGLFR